MNDEDKKIIAFDLRELKKYSDKFKEIPGLKDKIYLYDVENWMKDHPGGPDNLERAIESNKYYLKDDTIYDGVSPIELFANISKHGDQIVTKYLINENDNVKMIGYLKL